MPSFDEVWKFMHPRLFRHKFSVIIILKNSDIVLTSEFCVHVYFVAGKNCTSSIFFAHLTLTIMIHIGGRLPVRRLA